MKMRVARSFSLLAAGILGLTGIVLSAYAADTPLHQTSADTCQTCHKDIYKQWQGSMHASSSAIEDPIHATFYKNVAGDPTQEGVVLKASGKYPVCLQCHAPNAARDKTTKLDAMPAYSEGVNCIACHTLKKFNGLTGADGKMQLGLKSYEISDKIQAPTGMNRGLSKLSQGSDMFGGSATDDEQKPNPHLGEAVTVDGVEIPSLPMEGNPKQLKTNDACMGCHDKRNNPHGVALCQTGDEYSLSKTNVNCLSCHMPINNGVADHSMGGGHDQSMLKRSIVFDMEVTPNAGKLTANLLLKNQQPHSLPTGAPFRNIVVKVTAYNAAGETIWSNAADHPAKSDPQAYLAYGLTDSEGKPASPPEATALGEDTRLKPFEERTLSYEIPGEGVALVRGEVFYNLLWDGLVKKFKHLPADLTAPVLIAESEKDVTGS